MARRRAEADPGELEARLLSDEAVEAALDAQVDALTRYTMLNIAQGPGEGNFDRIQRLTAEDMLRAALQATKETGS